MVYMQYVRVRAKKNIENERTQNTKEKKRRKNIDRSYTKRPSRGRRE